MIEESEDTNNVVARIVLPLMVEKRRDPVILLLALRLDTVMEELIVIVLVVMLLPENVDADNVDALNAGTVKLPVTAKLTEVIEEVCMVDVFIDDAVIEDI